MKINVTDYWQHPPPEPSPRLRKWLAKIAGGWKRNRRIGFMGYHEASEFYGVYIWEYFNVLQPAIHDGVWWGNDGEKAIAEAWKERHGL